MVGWKNLQKILLGALLVLLPTQLGLHFWPSWALVNGIRIDYFSPTVYLTDILVLLLFLLEIFNLKFEILSQFFKLQTVNFKFTHKIGARLGITALILGLVCLNIIWSLSPTVTVYKWIKVLEMGWLGCYLYKNLSRNSLKLLIVPVVYESGLAAWQFLAQSSIGGLWYWLGERTFSSTTFGIANAIISGQLVLRAYGTFSHPNVLGGWLTVVLFLLTAEYLREMRGKRHKNWQIFALATGYMGMILSLSASAILGSILAITWLISQTVRIRKVRWMMVSFLLTVFVVFAVFFVPGKLVPGLSLVERLVLDATALAETTRSPIWGTGLGSSPIYSVDDLVEVSHSIYRNYALTYQPTHNIFLLVLAENGIWGLSLFLGLIYWIWRRAGRIGRAAIVLVLGLGMVDHYFLTSQQGLLLLTLVLAVAYRENGETDRI